MTQEARNPVWVSLVFSLQFLSLAGRWGSRLLLTLNGEGIGHQRNDGEKKKTINDFTETD
jgi:hypothetical protein